MTKNRAVFAVAAAALLVALAGCGSMGDILGGNPGTSANNEVRGTVDSVDLNSHSILLTNVSGYDSMLSSSGSSGGNTVRVYYDNNTTVQYNGQNYHPEDLDRGDQVDVRVSQSGNRLIADTMTVTYNATASSTYPNNSGTYNTTITGTVRNVDTSRRTIEIDRGYGSSVVVQYESNTPVTFNGRNYMPADLERGDQVSIYGRDLGNGRFTAQSVDVTRSISSSSGTSGNSNMSTIRGTVRSINTASRTIQLEQTSWISGFNTNTNMSVMTVYYDPNTSVDVSGQLYPITNLERGDVVDVQVSNLGTANVVANRITLVRDVRR